MPQTLATLTSRNKATSPETTIQHCAAAAAATPLSEFGLSSPAGSEHADSLQTSSKPELAARSEPAAEQPRSNHEPPHCQPRKLIDKFRVKNVLAINEQAGSAGAVTASVHGDSAEDAVDILLKLISTSESADVPGYGWPPESQPAAPAPGYAAPQLVLADMMIRDKRTFYELDRNETLADVARKFYGQAEIAGLIYKMNWTKIHTQFEPGLKLRVRMFQGIVLQLPTAKEAERYLADQQVVRRQRTLVYDVE